MSLGLHGCGCRQCCSQYSEGVKLVCILAPVWSSLVWVLWSGWVWAELDHSPAPGDFPFTLFTSIGKEKQDERESKEGRREQQRPRERNRGDMRRGEKGTEWWHLRKMNEIFILDPEKTRLLFLSSSHCFTLPFYIILLPRLPFLFLLYFIFSRILLCCSSLFLSLFPCISFSFLSPVSVLSETSPLVEVRKLFLSIRPVFLFPSLWKKNRKLQKHSFECDCNLEKYKKNVTLQKHYNYKTIDFCLIVEKFYEQHIVIDVPQPILCELFHPFKNLRGKAERLKGSPE